MPRLPARFAPFVQGFFLTMLMTFIISGVSTFMALGFSWTALGAWPYAWISSWVIAFPVVLFVLPLVRRIT